MHYKYTCKGTCSQCIDFDINDNIITNIKFTGGCPGNLKAVSKLVDGWSVEKIEQFLKGNTCGYRPTSCADQLALGVREALEASKK